MLVSITSSGLSQQCGNTTAAVEAAWDFYEYHVPEVTPIIKLSKLLDDIVELYNNFPNNGPGKAGYRGINIPTHQPQTGTTIGIGERVWLTPPSPDPHVEITIEKLDGKAKTQIDVCITNKNKIQEYVKSYTFEKNANIHSKTFVLKKVKEHIISIRVNPKFGTHKFKYKISIDSKKAETIKLKKGSTDIHPSGLESSGNVESRIVTGNEEGVRIHNPHPQNFARAPEHEIGGTYTMRIINNKGNIVSTGEAIINPNETPWLLTLIPNNNAVKFIKIRGELKDNRFKGYFEEDPSRKVGMEFKPNIKQFKGKVKHLLPNATFKTATLILEKT